jgi:hypothetical protein
VHHPCGVICDVTGLDDIIFTEAADEWATFKEVQAVVQLVMRKLQKVVTRDDREAMS